MNCILTPNDIEEIEMDLTGTCNLRCPLCTRNYAHAKHLLKKNVRPMSEICAQLDTFHNLQRFFIAGAISEPTLHPEFLDFIQYLNKRNIYYELFTNGNTHNAAWWNELGKLVPQKCITVFTVCGSTQKTHEKYRKGSSLQQILDNANAYRSATSNKNDWIQFIRFEYNKQELSLPTMKHIINSFSHHMIVDSEGIRRLNSKIEQVENGIAPVKKIDYAIKYIFSTRPELHNKDVIIQCKSFNQKKLYIDQFGNISSCYIHAEFEKDFFNANSYDYTKILNYGYPDCYLCSQKVNKYMDTLNLDFIC